MTNSANTALSLMQMALGLLDKEGEGSSHTACHLQAAIDSATGAQPMKAGDELDRALVERHIS